MERIKTALSKIDYVTVVLISLGLRSVVDANISQALIVACFSAIYGYKKYLETIKKEDVNAQVVNDVAELRNHVSSIMLKNAAKTAEAQQQMKRFF